LDIGWDLMGLLPRTELKRVSDKNAGKYLHAGDNKDATVASS